MYFEYPFRALLIILEKSYYEMQLYWTTLPEGMWRLTAKCPRRVKRSFQESPEFTIIS
jgi:hypothetical protein